MANKIGKVKSLIRDNAGNLTEIEIGKKRIEMEKNTYKFTKDIQVGDTVEYADDGKFLKKTDEDADTKNNQQTIEIVEEDDYKSTMVKCIEDVEEIYGNIADLEFRNKLDISSHINSMFIARTRPNGRKR